MAKNTGTGDSLKRTVYKYIRDGVKSNYIKNPVCEICGCSEDLELHHPHTISLVFDAYCLERGITVKGVEEVMAMRDEFYKTHWNELVVDVLTLCNTHHKALHKVYGAQPALSTASKQREWVQRIRDRLEGKDSQPIEHKPIERKPPSEGGFSKFITRTTNFLDHITRR